MQKSPPHAPKHVQLASSLMTSTVHVAPFRQGPPVQASTTTIQYRPSILTEKLIVKLDKYQNLLRGRRGRDRMVVGFTTTCAISAYHH